MKDDRVCWNCRFYKLGGVGRERSPGPGGKLGAVVECRVRECTHPLAGWIEEGFDQIHYGRWSHRVHGHCIDMRDDPEKCGPEGRWYEPDLLMRISSWFRRLFLR